jgi:hypothetical protein
MYLALNFVPNHYIMDHGYLIFQSGMATEKYSRSSSECEPQGLKLPEPLKADKMMIFDPTNVAANLNFHAG